MSEGVSGPVVLLILDGFGVGKKDKGDCVHLADPTNIDALMNEARNSNLYCELKAHGTAVGLPDDTDMGNSEVGHNALGSGQIIDQGAKLVSNAIADGSFFQSSSFQHIVTHLTTPTASPTVHLFGLLSDGNVHSHIAHFEALIEGFARRGVQRLRVHMLTDGRDVGSMSALEYVARLEAALAAGQAAAGEAASYKVGSGGGRMYVTMDRYGADWNIVRRGYEAMVHGRVSGEIVAECLPQNGGWTGKYTSAREAIEEARRRYPKKTDQDYPPFVIVDEITGEAVGKIETGDVVINANFRGDRAIEISRAFEEGAKFAEFDRGERPEVKYYGMLVYDSDKGIPRRSLCPNPVIKRTLTELLVRKEVKQYAVSETHKFGHVTYFWNGNRSGYVDEKKELYEEIRSDANEEIVNKPEMKAREIKIKLIEKIKEGEFKFIRANFANGDMVGHTGLIPETTEAVRVLDEVVGEIAEAVKKISGAVLIVTADHGNCEEKLDAKGNMKTSHTLNKVPFFCVGSGVKDKFKIDLSGIDTPGLANVAASVATLFAASTEGLGWQASLFRTVQ